MENTKHICYSLNDEDFIYDDFQELIEAIQDNGNFEVGATYYVAEFTKVKASDVVNINHLCEIIEEQLYDIVGEFSIDSFYYSGKVEELQKLIEDWIDNNTNISSFYRVEGISQEKKVTQEQLEMYK